VRSIQDAEVVAKLFMIVLLALASNKTDREDASPGPFDLHMLSLAD
jgi:hypothetical protein